MFALLAATSSTEREYIRDRTLEGRESSRRRGKTVGGAGVTDDDMLSMALYLRDIAARLVITTGKKKSQHPSPATVLREHDGTIAATESSGSPRHLALWVRDGSPADTARSIGHSSSTVSRDLRRNAAPRGGRLVYRALVARWHVVRQAGRPKTSGLAAPHGSSSTVSAVQAQTGQADLAHDAGDPLVVGRKLLLADS